MIRFILFLTLCLFASTSFAAGPGVFMMAAKKGPTKAMIYDDFHRASLGSNWTTITGYVVPNIYANSYIQHTSPNAGVYYSGQTFATDQYAIIDCEALTDNAIAAATVRTATSAETYYRAILYNNPTGPVLTFGIEKMVAGTLINRVSYPGSLAYYVGYCEGYPAYNDDEDACWSNGGTYYSNYTTDVKMIRIRVTGSNPAYIHADTYTVGGGWTNDVITYTDSTSPITAGFPGFIVANAAFIYSWEGGEL